jgi:hypothetical protein
LFIARVLGSTAQHIKLTSMALSVWDMTSLYCVICSRPCNGMWSHPVPLLILRGDIIIMMDAPLSHTPV